MLLLLALGSSTGVFAEGAAARDTYKNFAELAAHEKEGRDFSIALSDRRSAVSVFAIHGGRIDVGTERIARAIAGADWNEYLFIGPSYRLHLTSANFDEPRALSLAARSRRCLSIHGHTNTSPRICVGGADLRLRVQIARALASAHLPFAILTHCEGLDGAASTNLVNLCRSPGVQLELSSAARDALFADATLLAQTASAIRAAIGNH